MAVDSGPDHLRPLRGWQVPARGNRLSRRTFIFMAGERWLAMPRPFLERPEVTTASRFIHPGSRPDRLERCEASRLAVLNDARNILPQSAPPCCLPSGWSRSLAGISTAKRCWSVPPVARTMACLDSVRSSRPCSKSSPRSNPYPHLGFRRTLCRRAGMEFFGEIHGGRRRAYPVLSGFKPSSGIGPASEDRRHRQFGRLFGRPRPDHPALGHQ